MRTKQRGLFGQMATGYRYRHKVETFSERTRNITALHRMKVQFCTGVHVCTEQYKKSLEVVN